MNEINGQNILRAREALGISRENLGKSLCLSYKHIKELEEGGISSFFSHAHKDQVAKKVAEKLGLKESDVFIKSIQENNYQEQILLSSPAETRDITESNGITPTDSPVTTYFEKLNSIPTKKLLIIVISLIATLTIYAFSDDLVNAVTKQIATPQVAENKIQVTPEALELDICDIPQIDQQLTLTVVSASKPGNFIYVTSKTAQDICVIDSSKKINRVSLDAGGNMNVFGSPPFVINAKELNNLDIYYQGSKVKIPPEVSGPINLKQIQPNSIGN